MPMFTIATINRTCKGSQAYFNPPFWVKKRLKKRPRSPSTVRCPQLAVLVALLQGAHNGAQYTFPASGPKPAPIGGIKQNGVR